MSRKISLLNKRTNAILSRARKQAVPAVLLTLLCVPGTLAHERFSDVTTPLPLPEGSTLIIGFLGGIEQWNDPHRGVRKTALRLGELPGVYAEPIENHQRGLAIKLIYKALDANGDGHLDPGEKARARIILYGQSLGGWAVVRVARELNKAGIPVLLTVQIDSVGLDDTVVPPNVAAAANLYQRDFVPLRGAPSIRAADPTRTRILGNFQYRYAPGIAVAPDENVLKTMFLGAHKKMELDPAVWAHVEQLIRDALGVTPAASSTQSSHPTPVAWRRPDTSR